MNRDFVKALTEIEKDKGIPKEVLLEAIEAALVSSYKKKFNTAMNVRVDIDRKNGAMKVLARKMVVEDIIDERLEILFDEARKTHPEVELDEFIEIEVTPREFGRLAAQTAKAIVMQRIKEAERGIVYDAYVGKEEEVVTGKVQGLDSMNLYILLEGTEAVLPLNELLPKERYKLGDSVTAYISSVETSTKGTLIYLTRTHPGYLKKLFEKMIPEVQEGKVLIKSIAREAGQRSKVAVTSDSSEVDAVAACVGIKGQVIQSIMAELGGEKVDIIKWSEAPEEYIANSLAPASALEVKVFEDEEEDEPIARVIVPDHQLTLAIGIKGQNARLAAKLTGYKMDLYSEDQAYKQFNRPRTLQQ
ncbi:MULTISPECIES: transcription termination factor NusA [unclassified Paenibacillus]|uniref:Transcription termination/antitermination protein NusA n=1 Tax=Paenibacillus provencensis TaxID=441151 RepID=A0ABW3PYM3_9BACL|nr:MULTISPECIES: transcription termination factor NusA [unclassified Paenibacillus]MCM3130629.1 transcription termination factor NusA [Paenibacillus sp. MER 78]SDX74090.1 NusA antitermination factor [Paenibacillus sp. PDC88]SFS89614.1 NusA antitermination factor [Paenibacillus sp. 453mf]